MTNKEQDNLTSILDSKEKKINFTAGRGGYN